MTPMHRRLIWALAPAALAFATLAHAQPPGGPGGPVVRMIHGGQDGAGFKAMHEAMMEQHMEDLKTVLRLRPDQDAALQALMAAHHPPEGGPGAIMRHDGPPRPPKAMTTPERLAEMAEREQAMAAEHEKMRAALARFYAALTPEQQKVFDALQRLQGGHGHGPGGMMGGPRIRRIEIRRPGGPGEHPPAPGHEPD
jgi:hypothetical protein